MAVPTPRQTEKVLAYPDSDGKPMADNTLQFQWIVTVQGNLDGLFRDDPQVFVAGDLLWYPIAGEPETRTAPDVLVAFGRPKGYRGSYRQWEEGNVAPQVVWEIYSPGNTKRELAGKLDFYDRYGVEEYYFYNPYKATLEGWLRGRRKLNSLRKLHSWESPRLGIRFDLSGPELVLYRPDGKRFLTFVDLIAENEQWQQLARQAQRQADEERNAREEVQRQADQDWQRAEQLAARLRQLGIDPDQ